MKFKCQDTTSIYVPDHVQINPFALKRDKITEFDYAPSSNVIVMLDLYLKHVTRLN